MSVTVLFTPILNIFPLNPPKFNEATETDLVMQYQMEDELIKINSDLMSRYEKLSFSDAEFIHPYAHPKNPGKGKDHLGR